MYRQSVIPIVDLRYYIFFPVMVGRFINQKVGECLGIEDYPESYASRVVSDFWDSVQYATAYSITKGPLTNEDTEGSQKVVGLQRRFFEGCISPLVNSFTKLDKDHENFKSIQGSSNKILVSTALSVIMHLKQALITGGISYAPEDYYSLLKSVVKHAPILMCKVYFLPSMVSISMGQHLVVNSVCNMFGEIVEAIAKMGYSFMFEEETDLYELDEILSDIIFSFYKTIHHNVEEYSGTILKGFAEFFDSSAMEHMLKLFPVHYYVGGTLRRFVSKVSQKFSKNAVEYIPFGEGGAGLSEELVSQEKSVVIHLGMDVLCSDDGDICKIEIPKDCHYYLPGMNENQSVADFLEQPDHNSLAGQASSLLSEA